MLYRTYLLAKGRETAKKRPEGWTEMGSTAQMEERALDWKEGASKGQESGMRREVERVGAWVHLLFISAYKITDPTPLSSAAASRAPCIMQPAPEGGELGQGHRRGRPPRSAENHEGAEPTGREKVDAEPTSPTRPATPEVVPMGPAAQPMGARCAVRRRPARRLRRKGGGPSA